MLKAPGLIWSGLLLLAPLAASGADVSYYVVVKGKVYNQVNGAGPARFYRARSAN